MYLSSVPTGFDCERAAFVRLARRERGHADGSLRRVSLYGRNLTNEDGIVDLRTSATVSFEDDFQDADLHAAEDSGAQREDELLRGTVVSRSFCV